MSSTTNAIFVFLTLVALACVGALITFQVLEWKYYQKAPCVWTTPAGKPVFF